MIIFLIKYLCMYKYQSILSSQQKGRRQPRRGNWTVTVEATTIGWLYWHCILDSNICWTWLVTKKGSCLFCFINSSEPIILISSVTSNFSWWHLLPIVPITAHYNLWILAVMSYKAECRVMSSMLKSIYPWMQ